MPVGMHTGEDRHLLPTAVGRTGKAVNFAKSHNRKNYLKLQIDSESPKKESEIMEYQTSDRIVYKSWVYNREHSLDRVILNEFNRQNDTGIEQVQISYGRDSDEYTRSHHALAIAIANTIYFRNGAYKPETEEGRKLLAHELTHVAQNKEKEAYRNVSSEDKEIEAEQNEDTQSYNPDKMIKKTVRGKKYRLKESVWKKIDSMAIRHLENKIEMLKNSLSEEEYLKLLCQYQKWQETRGLTWGIG